MDKMTRRDLLRLGATAGIGTAFASFASFSPAHGAQRSRRARNPKNIIFMVSDGMSAGVPSLTESFSQIVRSKGSYWYKMLLDPEITMGFFDMASLNSLVTDSSSASCSWATGSRIVNGQINMLPDGTRLTPIAPLARQAKKKVALVTTTRITHATPAGFAAVVKQRDQEDEIAPQYLDVVDVLFGGGLRHYDPSSRADKRDLIGEYRAKGYELWTTRDQLMASNKPQKVLGLFYRSHLPYSVDHRNSMELQRTVPSLAEMTKAALAILESHKDGFLMQVEGGRVDHGAHSNDAAGVFFDQLAFDDAIEVAMEFAKRRGDTLVIVTSDHGNANPGLNGMGFEYGDSDQAFERIAQAKVSYELLPDKIKQAGGSPTPDLVREVSKNGFNVELEQAEAQVIADALSGKMMPVPNKQHRNLAGLLGGILSNYNGIGWIGTNHTADYVWISAFGPGQEQFAGLVRNTDAFHKMLKMMGVSHKNPSMTREEYETKYRHRTARVESQPHWV
jgi:alkaline phosphatase